MVPGSAPPEQRTGLRWLRGGCWPALPSRIASGSISPHDPTFSPPERRPSTPGGEQTPGVSERRNHPTPSLHSTPPSQKIHTVTTRASAPLANAWCRHPRVRELCGASYAACAMPLAWDSKRRIDNPVSCSLWGLPRGYTSPRECRGHAQPPTCTFSSISPTRTFSAHGRKPRRGAHIGGGSLGGRTSPRECRCLRIPSVRAEHPSPPARTVSPLDTRHSTLDTRHLTLDRGATTSNLEP